MLGRLNPQNLEDSMAVNYVPEGYRTVTPYMVIKGVDKAIDWYKKAFGAEELVRMPSPDGRVMHAEIKIGDSCVMMGDEFPEMAPDNKSPASLNGATTVGLHIYVKDCDAAFNKAVAAGAKAAAPPTDMFWGDRFSKVVDPFGHHWSIATHIEEVSPEEMGKRMQAAAAEMAEASKK
jgi:PhnB protein